MLIMNVQANDENSQFQAQRIAHAGGGLGKITYTNSYQALNANLRNGFRYFEIDFVFTSDERLVCLHDWKENFTRTFGFETERSLSFEEFGQLVENNQKFTNCTLEGLAGWMRENPSAFVVTDIRGDVLKALKLMFDNLPEANKRVIPQIYEPKHFETVSDMGFDQIIWTLYRYRGSNYQVIRWVEEWQNTKVAIAMSKNRVSTALLSGLAERGIPTYVHTINNLKEKEKLLTQFGVTEIYTDFLVP